MLDLEADLAPYADLVPRAPDEIPPGRLIVSGYFSATSGIGRGGRMSLEAFRAAGLQPISHDMQRQHDGWGETETGGVWFCHCNALEAADFLVRVDAPRGCYRIGYWAWELPNIPAQWAQAASLFHEIWTPSRFVMEAVRRGLPKTGAPKVRLAPHPLPDVAGVRRARARFGLAKDVFAFLAMYDVHSSATRKNPMGAVRAFQAAFSANRDDVVLLLKVVAAADSTSCLDDLIVATSGWPNIRILSDMLSDEDADRLICSADAFVSLHRSEGFGLSIAQAMAMGRPVIVTAWSGNMDFCTEGAALVDFALTPARDPYGVYAAFEGPGQVWADPNIASAAEAMRRFADDPAMARKLGEAGRSHIEGALTRAYDVGDLTRRLKATPSIGST